MLQVIQFLIIWLLFAVMIWKQKQNQQIPTRRLQSGETDQFMGVRLLALQQEKRMRRYQDGLSSDLIQMIGEFNRDEIQSLFNIFTSPEDRKLIIGYSSYKEMLEALPSWNERVRYLQSLRRDGVARTSIFVFDDRGTSITGIHLQSMFPCDYRNGVPVFPQGINWSAFRHLERLEELVLSVNGRNNDISMKEVDGEEVEEDEEMLIPFSLKISMNDLRCLPSSLERLSIEGNQWIGNDFNLEELPSKLVYLDADRCKGMDGILNLCGTESQLIRYVHMERNTFKKVTGWKCFPPNLQLLSIVRDGTVGRYADGLEIVDPFRRIPEAEHGALNRFASARNHRLLY